MTPLGLDAAAMLRAWQSHSASLENLFRSQGRTRPRRGTLTTQTMAFVPTVQQSQLRREQ